MSFLKKIYSAGTDKIKDEDLQYKVALSNRIALIIIAICSSYLPIAIYFFPLIWVYNVAAILLNILAIYMNASGLNKQGRFIISVSTPTLAYVTYAYLVEHYTEYFPSFIFTIISTCLISWLLFDLEERFWLFISVLLSLFLIVSQPYTYQYFVIDFDRNHAFDTELLFAAYFFPVILFIGFIYLSSSLKKKIREQRRNLIFEIQEQNEEIYSQNEELIQQQSQVKEAQDEVIKRKDELQEKSNQLEHSVNIASEIQAIILKSNSDLGDMPVDYFVYQEAKSRINGDFLFIKSEGETSLIICGETGETGLPGAMLNSFIVNEIKDLVKDITKTKIIEIYQVIHDLIKEKLHKSSFYNQVKDNFSVNIIKVNFSEGVLSYISTLGHIAFYDGESLSYAEASKETAKQVDVNVIKGNRVFLYTDGLWQQKNKDGEEFGVEKFMKLLTRNANEDVRTLNDKVRSTLHSWQGYEANTDDITLVGLEVF